MGLFERLGRGTCEGLDPPISDCGKFIGTAFSFNRLGVALRGEVQGVAFLLGVGLRGVPGVVLRGVPGVILRGGLFRGAEPRGVVARGVVSRGVVPRKEEPK